MASAWVVPLGQTPDYLDTCYQEALYEIDVIGVDAPLFFRSEASGRSHWELGMIINRYLIIGDGMTAAAEVDDIRTPVAIVREIKEHHGLNTRTCKGQTVIDRDAAVIGVSATVSPVCDERVGL